MHPLRTTAVIAGLALTLGLAVLVTACGGLSPAARGGASHQGMVQGTVWVANEYGNSITAIDAAKAA